MDYELAKKLEDAGFPLQRSRAVYGFEPETLTTTGQMTAIEGSHPLAHLVPTLSELIEALNWPSGYTKFVIESAKNPIEWSAWLDSLNDKPHAEGSTPEEAVARLWLALNAA